MTTSLHVSQHDAHQTPVPEKESPPWRGFRKILVAMDHSATSEILYKRAIALAQQSHGTLMLFHSMAEVAPSEMVFAAYTGLHGVYPHPEMTQTLQDEAIAQTENWLRFHSEQAIAQGVPTEFTYRSGEAGPRICTLARTWEADLILIGRRGRAGLTELVLGSVSNYVLHHAPCSVLIVQESASDSRKSD